MSNEKIDFDNRKAQFTVIGVVKRKFVANSGKFAELTLLVPNKNGKDMQYRVRAFDQEMVEACSNLGEGQSVCCKGTVDQEVLKNKVKENIEVDGYKAWVSVLTMRRIYVEEQKERKPKANPFDEGKTDDDLPF